jgi:hypothetical protein
MKEDPPLDAKCRDKFLVQSVVISANDDASNVASIWANIEKTNKSSVSERKIRVNFLPAGGATSSTVNGIYAQTEEPPAYSSPSPTQFGSPAPQSSSETPKSSVANAAQSTGVAAAASAAYAAVPKSGEDIKQQLAAANAQIQKLTSQLADPQLRQRKVQEASEKMQTVVAQTNEGGVPLQIVAGLCLLSFLIAYLFF